MNLDDFHLYNDIDQSDMLGEICGLSSQLDKGYALAQELDFSMKRPTAILICGMGGSAIGGDLLASYLAALSSMPIFVNREYTLPKWVYGPDFLVIASSHSGNTEETISAYKHALKNSCQTLALTTGGELARLARELQQPLWTFEHAGQPRAAVGYSFAFLLAVMEKLGTIRSQADEIEQAVRSMREQAALIEPNVEVVKNPAKRQAGQLIDRIPIFFASDMMAPVARRWKGQISELAKAVAIAEILPEADHNTISGIDFPVAIFEKATAIFIRSGFDYPRNQLRSKLTQKAYLQSGIGIDTYNAPGDTRLAQMFNAILFGDFLAYYLAIAYGVDPTPIPHIAEFKKVLG